MGVLLPLPPEFTCIITPRPQGDFFFFFFLGILSGNEYADSRECHGYL